MKIEPPLLPKRIAPPELPSASLRVVKHPNPGLDQIKESVRQIGVDKANDRFENRMAQSIDLANRRLRASVRSRNMEFGVHEESGRMMVRLTDNTTGQVIRTMPSEKFLENAAILHKRGMVKSIIG